MRRLRVAALGVLVAVLAVFSMGATACQHKSNPDNLSCAKILRDNPQFTSCKEAHA